MLTFGVRYRTNLRKDQVAAVGARPAHVKEASKRGVFAYIADADGQDWQSSIDIVLRRFAE